ncbi:hypothetical protein ACFPID_01915 [Bifidobacterium leontopitheci]
MDETSSTFLDPGVGAGCVRRRVSTFRVSSPFRWFPFLVELLLSYRKHQDAGRHNRMAGRTVMPL